MSKGWVAGSAGRVADGLAEMFRGHGIESVRDGDTLHFPAHRPLWVGGAAYREYPRALQLDVRLGLGRETTLVESVAGFGTEDEPAVRDGLEAFARCSLPVLAGAFFDRPQATDRFRWDVGGRKRVAFVGEVTTRFGFPLDPDGKPSIGFYHHFRRHLEAQPLPPGTHWIRVYHCRMDDRVLSNEVLLDNAPWPEMRDAIAAYDWPPSDGKTYDVRVLVVLKDTPSATP